MSVLFHFSLSLSKYDDRRSQIRTQTPEDERPLTDDAHEEEPAKSLFKTLPFYQTALLFVFARVFMTTAMVTIPLWLNERAQKDVNVRLFTSLTLANNIEDIATVPLISFVASFVTSVVFKQTSRFIGHRIGYLLGCLLAISGCLCVEFISTPSVDQLYVISIFYGAGHSLMIIASLSLTAEMIGATHTQQSGSIYAGVAFLDKLVTGIVIFVIQTM